MAEIVLLVDDEPLVTSALKKVLHGKGYKILCADSAKKALEIMHQQTVDVVVSDENMPGITGTLFFSVIRHDFPDTVRIMLTGQASLEVAVHAINNGEIYRFLMKPCSGDVLASSISQALQHRKLLLASRNLLNMSRQQNQFIKNMEAIYPGISEVKRNVQGGIIIEETLADVNELIQDMNTEVQKTEVYYTDWSVPE